MTTKKKLTPPTNIYAFLEPDGDSEPLLMAFNTLEDAADYDGGNSSIIGTYELVYKGKYKTETNVIEL